MKNTIFNQNFESVSNISFEELSNDSTRKDYAQELIDNGFQYTLTDDINGTDHYLVNGQVFKNVSEADIEAEFQLNNYQRNCVVIPISSLKD